MAGESAEIWFFDAGRLTGYCFGSPGQKIPDSGSIELYKPGQSTAIGIGSFGRFLRDRVRERGKPKLVGIEKWMPIPASKDDDSSEWALRQNGALHAILGVYGIPAVEPTATEIRMAVCGRAFGYGPKGKRATKEMVAETVWMLGLLPTKCQDGVLPPRCKDYNRTDAIAGWRFVEATMFGRASDRFSLTA